MHLGSIDEINIGLLFTKTIFLDFFLPTLESIQNEFGNNKECEKYYKMLSKLIEEN